MGEERNRWNWEVQGFERRRSVENEDNQKIPPVMRRFSMPSTSAFSMQSKSKGVLTSKFHKLKNQVKNAKEEYLELRQEATDLQQYSSVRLDRVNRYLNVLADRARKLDQAALETEARLSPLINERRLFNDLLTAKGNVKVFCRTRPLFEDEGPSIVEFPDNFTICININDETVANPKKHFEFDRVYGPHVDQGELFHDVQPFVQSAMDGYNVSIFSYGQARSGKTYTMEGSSHDRGLYVRSFEELFDLSNSDATSTSRFNFYVTAFDLYNEEVQDLLSGFRNSLPKVRMGPPDSFVELVQEKVENPVDFTRVLKAGTQSRGKFGFRTSVSHMVVTIHIHYSNWVTRENQHSKLSLIDLAGSESLLLEDSSGGRVTDLLHVMKSLSALGDVMSSLTSKKETIPYGNSRLTKILEDSLGGSSKTLMIVNVCPNASNLSVTLSSLNFSSRARSAELNLGSRDTIKKWRDVANDSRKELYEKEKECQDLKQEILEMKQALKESNEQCSLLFNEIQKAWKVSSTLQENLKSEITILSDKHKIEKEHNAQLRNQLSNLLQLEQDQKIQIQERDATINILQTKIKNNDLQVSKDPQYNDHKPKLVLSTRSGDASLTPKVAEDNSDTSLVTKKLEEELAKRDALIERLHEENEKLFGRLTEKFPSGTSPQASSPSSKGQSSVPSRDPSKNKINSGQEVNSAPTTAALTENTGALVKSDPEKVKTTPAGEYLTAALMEFDPEQYDGLATISDGANKLLMLVLAAVIKAGAAREHEILAEIRDAVFSFIRRMEQRMVMDTMLVSRVRILYIRSLLARSPELQTIKVSPVECYLEKANSGRSRSSSRGNSPSRSPIHPNARIALLKDHIQGFKVKIKQEKKSKFSSIVKKLRGIDQDSWKQNVTGGNLREITEEAKSFAVGNKSLASLFVHTPAGELQRQIRTWLAENFEFLSLTDGDGIGGTMGQLELLSTAIMDGWMAGLGAPQIPNTDALGQLLSDYSKKVYSSQLQHLKDIAGTLAMEEAEDIPQVNKMRSALESVDHKRRKILQQMQNDTALLKEESDSSINHPSTAAEDARLASLISLDGILKQVQEIMKLGSLNSMTKRKKKSVLASLDELMDQMSSLLDIDHPCAKRQIAVARTLIESVPEQEDQMSVEIQVPQPPKVWTTGQEIEVTHWNVLQFNTGSTAPFIIKCGANSNLELVIKADARVQEPKGGEIIRVVPKPSVLLNMNLEEMRQVFSQLPEALSLLALARTEDGTRARYSRLYRTLAMKVPSLRDVVGELEKGGIMKDTR